MKICFDNEIFWTQKFGGISSRYFFNLIKILSNNNNLDVKVFAKFYLNKKIDDLSKKIVIGNRVKFDLLKKQRNFPAIPVIKGIVCCS